MTTPVPGTPEWQEAYDKETKRLEAEAATAGGKKPGEAASNTSAEAAPQNKADAKADDRKEPTATELAAQIDEERKARKALEKSLKDTQRWGHDLATKAKKLEREADDRRRRETLADDPLLKANPGLEDTIKRVVNPAANPTDEDAKANWLGTVARAVPDVEELLEDQNFRAKAAERKSSLGSEWDDPIVAIRELTSLKADHLSQRNVQAAVEAARKDFEVKAKKRNAMEVPGGSGGKDQAAGGDDAVKRFQTMSKEEFAKERSRVMGY